MIKEPLKFQPILRETIWGGRRLELYGKQLPPGQKIGESWEVSDITGAISVVREGTLAGYSLRTLLRIYPDRIISTNGALLPNGSFPLMIKFIDAHDTLSLQVHPPDHYALQHENGKLGKVEAWFVLEAEPGSYLYCGLREGVGREDFLEAIVKGQPHSLLKRYPVKPRDVFFIPPGTLHALGRRILILEVQQTSDIVYRVYDWGRQGRELHIEKALEVIKFGGDGGGLVEPSASASKASTTELLRCERFSMELFDLRQARRFFLGDSPCHLIVCIEGEAQLITDNASTLKKGDTVLIPASLEGYTITPPERVSIVRAIPACPEKQGRTQRNSRISDN